ncbi:hypothetical protein BX616_003950 [Lobosporangium transversale]|uniref:Secreted protein n=1 Tax=Lobosporangium transversale TaxID=64571 RepID=A0A1Y2GNS3_9FUNG|nr:hypothetical protein BCR41DRAFT_353104 [Lobosporangium transversale]KAF9916364.1 hypothetical protein BX616_003950 [Lobosporangium transversale]ORZ16749.1 hypothetical protein BCR41DRAFT_353104 [Lobosporangium transversale]|eukprot:XP_021881684.1 hypothetical protein BCR41DRAFT_353104 [Lobosporangium transversale]
MQFKTLAIVAVAVAAASTVQAQGFANNSCTQCVFGSFAKDTTCAKLSKEDFTELTNAFAGNNEVNVPAIIAAIQKPDTKACVCSWSTTAFKPDGTGPAGSCFTGTTPAPACNSSQVDEANGQLAPLGPILKCNASPSGSPSGGKPSSTGNPAPSTTKPSSGVQLNMPYVLSIAAVGLAALAGL